jgi:hypothetical protein
MPNFNWTALKALGSSIKEVSKSIWWIKYHKKTNSQIEAINSRKRSNSIKNFKRKKRRGNIYGEKKNYEKMEIGDSEEGLIFKADIDI